MHKGWRIALFIMGLIIVLGAGFVLWGEIPAQPLPEALAALQSDAQVTVTAEPWLVFTPATAQPTTGFIFYPGGRVDYRAYAPAAHQIAAQGYLVVIVRMPLNLAVFRPNAASEVINTYPQIKHWAIGGHSLGGAMAANFAKNNPDAIQGLGLWGTYPAASDDLSASKLKVVLISGTLDGLSTVEKVETSRTLLPANTTWVAIPGGNHSQFGWYGDQAGDNPASISRIDQQSQVVAATLEMLEGLK